MIYFDNNKQAYAYEIPNYITTLEDNVWAVYAGTDKWDIIEGVFTDITDTDEYKKKKEAEEKERISHLKCTKRVLVLILEQLGKNFYEDILPLIESNRQAKLEWDLCVELERSNPLINIIGNQLGISTDSIDDIFRYANGEILLIPKEEING